MRRFASVFPLLPLAALLASFGASFGCDDSSIAAKPPTTTPRRDAGAGEAGATVSPGLRIATFNTHLFFDTVCESSQCGDGEFEKVLTQAQFDEQVRLRAAAIEKLETALRTPGACRWDGVHSTVPLVGELVAQFSIKSTMYMAIRPRSGPPCPSPASLPRPRACAPV